MICAFPLVVIDKAEELDERAQKLYELLQVAYHMTKDAPMLEVMRNEVEEELGYSLADKDGQKKLATAISSEWRKIRIISMA